MPITGDYNFLVSIANAEPDNKIVKNVNHGTERMFSEGALFMHHLRFFGLGELELIEGAKGKYEDKISAFIPNSFGIETSNFLLLDSIALWNRKDLYFILENKEKNKIKKKGSNPINIVKNTVDNAKEADRNGVCTFKTTLSKFDNITDGRPVLVVMDKGFFSLKNVNIMLRDKKIKKFIISIPFTSSFAKQQVISERKDIDSVQNTIVINGDSMRAVTKVRAWDKDHRVFTHIYYSAKKAFQRREEIYAHVAVLREEAEKFPARYVDNDDYTKYLNIRKSEKAESGYTVSIREDVINSELETASWVIIISNDIDNAKKAMCIYREKDVVEKGFLRLKKSLDLGRLRVHSQESMQNKVFVGFIALVLLSEIHKVVSDAGMYKSKTLKQLLHTLSRHRIQEINGTRIIYPATKEQRNIYKAFKVEEPV